MYLRPCFKVFIWCKGLFVLLFLLLLLYLKQWIQGKNRYKRLSSETLASLLRREKQGNLTAMNEASL